MVRAHGEAVGFPSRPAEPPGTNDHLWWATNALGLGTEDIVRSFGVSLTDLRDWPGNQDDLPLHRRTRLKAVDELRSWLDEVFRRDEAAQRAWLLASIPALGGRTPLESVRDGRMDQVIGILASWQAGTFL